MNIISGHRPNDSSYRKLRRVYGIPCSGAQEISTAVMPQGTASAFVQTVVRVLLIPAARWQLFQSHSSLTCIIMQTWFRLCASEILHGPPFLWRHDISGSRGYLYHGSRSLLWLVTFHIERLRKRNMHSNSRRQGKEFVRCNLKEVELSLIHNSYWPSGLRTERFALVWVMGQQTCGVSEQL
jgi:hypothetical protein